MKSILPKFRPIAVLALLLTACGEGTESTVVVPGVEHARIAMFQAEPGTVTAGEEVTVSWRTENATGIRLMRNDVALDLGDAGAAEGTVSVVVNEASTFLLEATGSTEVVAKETRAVQVSATARPAIVSFVSELEVVDFGATATLRWQTRDADRIQILDAAGTELPLGDAAAAEGSVGTPALEADATFKLVALREGVPSTEKTITVRVRPEELLRITSFTAEPAEVDEGGSSRLAWITENAESIRLFDGAEELELDGQQAARGSVAVFPTGATNYRLIATRGAQSDEKTLLVRVKGYPIAMLAIAPSIVSLGESATLTWTSTDAESVRIADSLGRPLPGGDVETNGTRVVDPTVTTTWVLTAVGATGNESHATAMVEVQPQVFSFGLVDQAPAGEGDRVELNWRTGAATSVEISNLEGVTQTFLGEEAAGGSAVLPVGSAGRFEIVARSGRLEDRRAIVIEPIAEPSIARLEASADVVTLRDGFATVRISWSGVNRATSLDLTGEGGAPIDLGSRSIEADFVDVDIAADTTFTLTARNDAGTDTATVSVRAVPLPAVTSVTVWPDYVGPGEDVDLSWDTTGATRVEILANGVAVSGIHGATGTITVSVGIATTFEVRASNDALDFDVGAASVMVGGPQILELNASRTNAWTGSPITFDWKTRGAGILRVSSASGIEHTTASRADVVEGSFTTAPLANGEYDYELTIENAAGARRTATLHVRVGAGPSIESFTVNPSQLLAGTTATVRWTAGPDPDGALPTLSLTANRGGPYLLPPGSAGSSTFTLDEPGAYDFTLAATTGSTGSIATTRQASIAVYGYPAVTLTASPTVFDDQNDTHVDLAWTSANADFSLELFQLDGANPPILLGSIPTANRASGTRAEGAPTQATTFRLVATNGLGMKAQQEVTVSMEGTLVLSFDAEASVTYPNPPAPPTVAVVQGDEVELSWTTKRATSVDIDVVGPFTVANGSAYADISGGLTPLVLTSGTADGGYVDVPFPAGFTFEYFGTTYSSARMFVDGFVSFLMTASTSSSNYELPLAGSSQVHLAPFWEDNHLRTGNLYAGQVGTDFVFEWKGISPYYGSNDPTPNNYDLNFQVVLHADGTFEYRYGAMTPPPSPSPTYCEPDNCVGEANGASATIGFQNPAGTKGGTVHFGGTNSNVASNVPYAGGLANRSFRFDPRAPLAVHGSVNWVPRGGSSVVARTAKITASGVGSGSATVSVNVHPRAVVTLTAPDNVTRNELFSIGWQSTNATALVVQDGTGGVLCTAAQNQVASGTCTVTEATTGLKTYRVIATGALGHIVQKDIEIPVVSADFGITSFTASASQVNYGTPVVLSWETGDSDVLEIRANGALLTLPPGLDRDSDSFTVASLTEATTFELKIVNTAFGSVDTRTTSVTVRTFSFDFEASSYDVPPGQPVTLTWAANSLTGANPVVTFPKFPMVEDTSGSKAFIDITGLPGVTPVTLTGGDDTGSGTLTFTNGFTFPFDGANRTSAIVKVDGFLSFASSSGTTGGNSLLPTTATPTVHLAPFWDDLHRRAVGTILAGPVGNDYIISWNHWSQYYPSTGAGPYDLNFQVVLHPDGSFEYRYGAMAAPSNPPANTTSCYPSTCAAEANAASATIGYQKPNGTDGHLIHYGGASNAASNRQFPGGIANRTFVYSPPLPSGQVTIAPTADISYQVCVALGGFQECKTVQVKAEFLVQSFDVSAAAIDWGELIDLTWATKNADTFTIQANGTVIADETTAPIAGGILVHSPTETTTYVLTAHNAVLNRNLTATKTVTVRQFEIDLTAPGLTPGQPVAPGSPVTLSWNANMYSGGAMVLTTPLEDVTGTSAFYDVTLNPGVVPLHGASADDQVANHAFGGGFVFPFLGTPQASVQVGVNGFLSFDASPGAQASNNSMPNSDTTYRKVHLAPFWDNLYTRTTGRVDALVVDPDTYIIQWSHVSAAGSSTTNEYNLNFQVVLHSDGSFEYRYGTMAAPPTTSTSCFPSSCVNEAAGSSATIGYQHSSGVAGYQLHFGGTSGAAGNLPAAGGLAGRAFRFTPRSGSGSMVVNPADSRTYRICAVSGAFVECSGTVSVDAPWSIVAFEATPKAVVPGDPLTLSWSTLGGQEIVVKATTGGVESVIYSTTTDVDHGTFVTTTTQATTYTLELVSFGRVKKATQSVILRDVSVEFVATPSPALPGASVTLDWTVTPNGPGTPQIALPMLPVDSSPGSGFEFIDVSGQTSKTQIIAGNIDSNVYGHTFPSGFTFPFMGTTYTSVRVSNDGYLSFDTSTSGSGSNQTIPNTDSTYKRANLAVFWDDLQTRTNGRVYGYLLNASTYIIQWSHTSIYFGSSSTNEYDLNFQVVLHSDGRFEYRYGTMTPPPTPATSATDCAPLSCVNETKGSSATIGYQDTSGTIGHQIHFGGNARALTNPIYPGGLANKAFAFDPNLAPPVVVQDQSTAAYAVCAKLGTYSECSKKNVYRYGEGSVVFSELMIDPAGGATDQWFEVRNLLPVEIDMGGWTISTTGGVYTIGAPMVVGPNGFAVFSASSMAGISRGVYGTALPINVSGDTLSLQIGNLLLSSVTWGPGWTVPSGASLELDPRKQKVGSGVFSTPAPYCVAETLFDGVTFGTPGSNASCDTLAYRVDRHSTYPFIDIRTTGTSVSALAVDTATALIPVSFSMPLFDTTATKIWANTNGYVSFSSSNTAPTNSHYAPTTLPRASTATPEGPLLAAFWDDHGCSGSTPSFQYEQKSVSGYTVTILQWTGTNRCGATGTTTFQAQLWSDGLIVVAFDTFASSAYYQGQEAWIALEPMDRSDYVTAYFRELALVPGQSIAFTRK